MAVVRSEFALALNQVATERGIDPTVVVETIKAAILAAYRKDFGEGEEDDGVSAHIDPDTGEAKIMKDGKNITPAGFGRIATQTAKQVILQRVREAEKQAILSDYAAKIGDVVSGRVLRFDGPSIVVDVGRAEGIMPQSEQIPNERYRLNQRHTFFIESIKEGHRGSEIIVSRASKGLVEGLFKREVPEVANNAVEIKAIAREPGYRTKIAVFSGQPGVDPVGSCVGQKGVRVQAVIAELGGMEKIDIIQWHADAKQFLNAAMSPAKDMDITLDEEHMTAEVFVPEDQLSLAIGKEGQNVRLAAKLTGWKIDIKPKALTPAEIKKMEELKEAEAAKEAIAASAPIESDAKEEPIEAVAKDSPRTDSEQAGTQEDKEASAVAEQPQASTPTVQDDTKQPEKEEKKEEKEETA